MLTKFNLSMLLVAVCTSGSALGASRKMVNINIDTNDLEKLKGPSGVGNYKLCFAKKVGDNAYNVVWHSSDEYLAKNKFSWTPKYEIFASNNFSPGLEISTTTQTIAIGLGEGTTLSAQGIMGPASTVAPPTDKSDFALTMKNDYNWIHPGVNQVSVGLDGKSVSNPIYLSKSPVTKGSTELEPIEKILVWFQQDVQTSTMFSESRSNSIEIDLTASNEETRTYSNGVWSTP